MIQDFDDTTTIDSKVQTVTRSLKSRIFLFEASRVLSDSNATNEDLERALQCCVDDTAAPIESDDDEFKISSCLVRAKILKRLNRDEEAREIVSLALKSSPDDPNIIRTAITLSSNEDRDALCLLKKLRDDEYVSINSVFHVSTTGLK